MKRIPQAAIWTFGIFFLPASATSATVNPLKCDGVLQDLARVDQYVQSIRHDLSIIAGNPVRNNLDPERASNPSPEKDSARKRACGDYARAIFAVNAMSDDFAAGGQCSKKFNAGKAGLEAARASAEKALGGKLDCKDAHQREEEQAEQQKTFAGPGSNSAHCHIMLISVKEAEQLHQRALEQMKKPEWAEAARKDWCRMYQSRKALLVELPAAFAPGGHCASEKGLPDFKERLAIKEKLDKEFAGAMKCTP